MNRIKKIIREMSREELEIQHKLLNLILSAAFVGGIVSLIVSIMIGLNITAIITIAFLIVVVGFSLWIANKKNKPQIAALTIVIAANMMIFPVMYFTSGGLFSGMPVWLVLGMIFSWLILTGKLCIVMYLLNAIVVVGCIVIEMEYPELVIPLENRNAVYWDMIQSMLIVTVIFGLIFKYQTYVYEKQKKQILKANQAKSEFLANMSHEVRTPINAILGYNEMIIKESGESQTVTNAMNVQAAGKILLSLVDDIFDYTIIEKEGLELKNEPYFVREILNDVFTYAKYCAEKKGLEIRFEVDGNIPQVLLGDSSRFMQILDNLISNGVKYTKEGYVEVTLKWENISDKQGRLFVNIKDTGIGMKKEDVEKISDSFIRFDNQQTRNIQGIGLGLTKVTRLLKSMNSELLVESEFGKGSQFSFELMQEIKDNTPVGNFDKENDFSMLEHLEETEFVAPNARVLAVDDNQMNLELIKGMLKNTKMQIDTAMNGKEAIGLVKSGKYDIILMDHMMPVMDGIEALTQIKNEKLCDDIPVIVLTANAVGDARKEYLEAGFDDYLSKPVLSGQLLAVIKKYLPEELVAGEEEQTEQFYFLDTKVGMEYCCNSEEFYKEMLGTYLTNDKRGELDASYDKEDWEQYRITVHALKSTSLSIGATHVSEEAKKLEMAAKEGRTDYIKDNHRTVMVEYETLLNQLSKALEQKNENISENIKQEEQEKEHILIVDDDAMNLKIAEKMLENMYEISLVKSGKETMEFLKERIPNLILLDLHMPEMNGFEVISKLKQDERLKDIPVIFLTADNDKENEVKGFNEGALDFITKPFIADIMLKRIARILELDRLQKNLQQEVKKQTREAEERRQKVENLSFEMMLTLANAIDAKDKYTNGHSVRVAEYAREIARRIGKTEQEQNEIYHIGLLHDIGKIGIPNTIINKASKLTDEEYEIIKTHPKIGGDILKNITEIEGLAVGARWHHERYDGKGYPDGFKGEEIPEIARIIGVADAYDAMASKRSYRDVLPQKVVREEIQKGKGTQFDPHFAEIMIEMIDEDKEYQLCEQC